MWGLQTSNNTNTLEKSNNNKQLLNSTYNPVLNIPKSTASTQLGSKGKNDLNEIQN